MSSEKETPGVIGDMELLNRARNKAAAEPIETPREREIANFMASAEPQEDLNPLTIDSRAARSSLAAGKQRAGIVQ
jgi:hypothetical protein